MSRIDDLEDNPIFYISRTIEITKILKPDMNSPHKKQVSEQFTKVSSSFVFSQSQFQVSGPLQMTPDFVRVRVRVRGYRVMVQRLFSCLYITTLVSTSPKTVRFRIYITENRIGITKVVNIVYISQKLVPHHFFVYTSPKIGSTSPHLDIHHQKLYIHYKRGYSSLFLGKIVYVSPKQDLHHQ